MAFWSTGLGLLDLAHRLHEQSIIISCFHTLLELNGPLVLHCNSVDEKTKALVNFGLDEDRTLPLSCGLHGKVNNVALHDKYFC